ncbi:MAG: hypothetical protein R6X16_11170 [Anaerolineae bacterium]
MANTVESLIDDSLFDDLNFELTVRGFCSDQGWTIDDVGSGYARLVFSMSSGRRQTLWISRYGSTLEFSVPSALAYDDEDAVPGSLSTALLKLNAKNKIGFWCIEEIDSKYVFSYMHNAEIQLVNSQYFARVVKAVLQQCDIVDGAAAAAFGS